MQFQPSIQRNTNVSIRSGSDVCTVKFVTHLWEKHEGASFRRELRAMGFLLNTLPACVWVSRSVKVIREINGEEGIYDRHDCWKTDADTIPTLLRTSTRHQHRQTAEELKEEDCAAHLAKLQELIWQGTPCDLAATQELMKALAGANPDAKPDHRTQALTELNKLKQKVILLNEMLNNFDMQRSEQFAKGDVYDYPPSSHLQGPDSQTAEMDLGRADR
ncbi:hypothetical protein C0993_008887 [Termitomyces sp. T159_Od127]|nr:hypothetical protein C0993_008887 [Termitomyces sp. T159_Od127]